MRYPWGPGGSIPTDNGAEIEALAGSHANSRFQDFGSRKVRACMNGIADSFNGHIDAFRISHVQRSDGWVETNWNNLSDPAALAVAGAREQEGGDG
jgi:hypothetical protein